MHSNLHTLFPALDLPALAPLVPAASLTPLSRLAERLPPLSGMGLECPLGRRPDARVDLATRFTLAHGAAALLAEPSWRQGDDTEGWRRIGAFARAWGDPAQPLARAIPEGWLEFDVEVEPGSALPTPSLFLKLHDHYARPPLLGPKVAARHDATLAVLDAALATLNPAMESGTRERIEQVIRTMPAPTHLRYLGLMLAREQRGCRLTLTRMPISELTAFLDKVAWPHALEPVVGLCDLLLDHDQHVVLHLDVGESIGPRLGFEVHLDTPSAWRRLLQHLAPLGLSTPEQIEAALAWPGRLTPALIGDAWPPLLDPRSGYLMRAINHVKLSYQAPAHGLPQHQPGRPIPAALSAASMALDAKIYLALNYGSSLSPSRIVVPRQARG